MASYSKLYNFIEKLKILGAVEADVREDDVGGVSCSVKFKNEVVIREPLPDWRANKDELDEARYEQMQQEAFEEVAYLSSEDN